jgi:hypothetical protein
MRAGSKGVAAVLGNSGIGDTSGSGPVIAGTGKCGCKGKCGGGIDATIWRGMG